MVSEEYWPMPSDTDKCALLERGFEYITAWKLRGETIKPVSLDWTEASGWIYAFITEGRVRYFGISTTVLRSRLDGYSYQINDRVSALIRGLVSADQYVAIYGLRRPGRTKEELEREESELITEFETDWNVRR